MKPLNKQNILFFTRTMKLGGTENVIIQMCEILRPYVNKIVVCSCGGINVEKLNKLDIKHYEIPDIDNKSLSTIAKVFLEVPKIIKSENITIVHTHHRMATFYMHFINKIYRLKLVSTLHGIFSDKKMLTRMVYKKIDIIACGKIVKDSFIETYKIGPEKIVVISNAISQNYTEFVELACLKTVPKDYKKVGYVGRLSSEKGVQILISAIQMIISSNNKIVFVIAGSGEMESELKETVRREGLDDIVYFLGYREDAQNVIKQMDAIVLPSFTEGLPLTPIEAFAYGKPLVATAVGGTIEIVKDGVNGILVPAGDTVALAEGFLELFKDKSKFEKMSIEALKTYEENFTFEKFKAGILRFYKTLCEKEK